MKISAWRIYRPARAAFAFTGAGASFLGGRWNSVGTALVYTGGTPAIAAMEMLVHIGAAEILLKYELAQVEFDESLVADATVPAGWDANPAPAVAQAVGDKWVTSLTSAVLRVPSAVLPLEANYLLNPAHPDFPKIVIMKTNPFRFDPRLK